MTDIEQKALALVNEVAAFAVCEKLSFAPSHDLRDALCRAIERHEAFRQEVSEAVKAYVGTDNYLGKFNDTLGRFILPQPDPLVEAMLRAWPQYADRMDACSNDAEALRAAIEKRGGKIVWGEG